MVPQPCLVGFISLFDGWDIQPTTPLIAAGSFMPQERVLGEQAVSTPAGE